MAGKFPEAYTDPLYSTLDSGNESKLGLPVGLLSSIRTAGEKSNASATNKLGTSSPYQFIPATRKAILDKYGIDVLLSPENASEGAGLLLKESLDRNDNNIERAVREYHGGTDPDNWGPVNNAYAKRVLAAQSGAKSAALSSGFAKFMANNPAIPANRSLSAPTAAESVAPVSAEAPATDAMAAGFGKFLQQQQAQTTAKTAQAATAQAMPAEPTFVDKLIGAGEAGLTLATGATGGTVGMLGGFIGGVPAAIATGEIGSQEGVRNVEEATFQGMRGLTYQPRTQLGQEYAGNVGEVMMQAVPALPLTAEMNAIGRIAANAGRAGRVVGGAAAQAATDRMRAAAPNVAARVDRVMRRNPAPDAAPAAVPAAAAMTPEQIARLAQLDEQVAGAPSRPITAADGTPLELPGRAPRRLSEAEAAEQAALQAQRAAQEAADAAPAIPAADTSTPTPGTLGSAGAAGTDMLAQRRELAGRVGIEPTYGQLTRDPQNLRFEAEMAKGPQGAKLVERYSQQNAQMMQHFDNLVDMTGAEAADLAGVGRAVDSVLRKELARDKNEVRVAYQKADKSPEAAAPVVLEDAVQFLNESAPDQAVSPLLVAARSRALKLGVAKEGADGELVAIPTTVKNAELFRRAVGSATDFEPTNIRNSAIIKGAVDTATEAIAGPMYRSARRLRENLGNKYENRGMVADLLNNKRGMKDRKVAVEDVFKRTILNGTREELSHLRSVLQAGGDTGKQAWKELQGATVNWIKDEAFTNTASDATGKTILSVPKLANAVKKLEQGGKLKFILGGEQGAQHMRDLVDLSKVIYTAPPGVINHSNTASVLLAALTEAGAVGTMTGLPVPVLSALRALSVHAKNRAIQKRIDAALSGRDYKAPKNPATF